MGIINDHIIIAVDSYAFDNFVIVATIKLTYNQKLAKTRHTKSKLFESTIDIPFLCIFIL